MARRRKNESKAPMKQRPKSLVRKSTRQKAKKQQLEDGGEVDGIITSENTNCFKNSINGEELPTKIEDLNNSKLHEECISKDISTVNIEDNPDKQDYENNSTVNVTSVDKLECDKPTTVDENILNSVCPEDEIEETTIYEEMEIETESTDDSSFISNKNTMNQVSFINDSELKEKNTLELSGNKIINDSVMITSEHFDKSLLINCEFANSNSYQMVEEGLSGLHVSEICESSKSPVLTIVEENCKTSHTPFDNFNGNIEILSQVENKKIVKNTKVKKFAGALMKSNSKIENDSNTGDESFQTESKEKIMKNLSKQNEQSLLLSNELEIKNEANEKDNVTLIINKISSEKEYDKFLSTLADKKLVKEHSMDSEINSKMDFEDTKSSSSSENSSDVLLPKTCGMLDLNTKDELDKQCEINNEKTKNKSEDATKSDSGSNHSGVRRSNRIKHIGLQKQRSRGRGLVIKPIQESQKVSVSDNLTSNAAVVPEQQQGNQITKNMKNLVQMQFDKPSSKCTMVDNLPSVINYDSNANKPVKVKSRWRKSSELEMSNCTSWSVVTQSSNVSFAGNNVSVEDGLSNSAINKESNCSIDPLRIPEVVSNQEYDKRTIPCEDSVTSKIITSTLSNNSSQNVSIVSNSIGAKMFLPMVSEVDREMEERLSQFEHLRENLYLTERYTNKETKRMVCDCFLTEEEIQRGELGCGEDCLNRLLMIECGSRCIVGDRCTNRRFQNCNYAKCEVFRTEKKGFGLRAITDLNAGEFIMEYVGEVVDSRDFRRRAKEYSKDKNRHYYFMALKSDQIIDATMKGNISRFINHSCDPNAETQKWTVNGELRIGFFNKKFVAAGEEITFDYHFQRYGKEAQKCFCEAANCRGWIGDNPEDNKTNAECAEHDDDDDDDDDVDDDDDDDDDEDDNDGTSEKEFEKNKREDRKEKAEKQTRRSKREDKKIVDHMEDEDLEEQIDRLCASGLKNRAHTLTLSRLMVRCRELQHRRRLLEVIQSGEQPCRRLFLDYHGLRLMWSYMMDVAGSDSEEAQRFRLEVVKTLITLPIPNRTMLIDSKVLSVVEKWSKQLYHSPSGDSPSEEVEMKEATSDRDSNVEPKKEDEATAVAPEQLLLSELTGNLLESWASLKEVFRIPKKERLEQMKEHEREADRGYKEDAEREARETLSYERHRAERYRGGGGEPDKRPERPERRRGQESLDLVQVPRMNKFERRQLFALKVAQEEEERQRRQREELWQQHQAQCLALGVDPYATAALDPQSGYPLFFEPQLAQWQAFPGQAEQLYRPAQAGPAPAPAPEAGGEPGAPAAADAAQPPPALDLPPKWRWARDKRGRVYYYHTRERVPQWLPPPPDHIGLQPDSGPDSSSDESSDESGSSRDNDEDEEDEAGRAPAAPLDEAEPAERDAPDDDEEAPDGMDLDPPSAPPRPEARRRRDGLVQERIISPRREEDRVDHSKFKELKDKLRRQKEKSRLKEQLQSEKLRKHRRSLKSKSHAKQTGQVKPFQTITSDMSPTSERKIKDTFRINMAHVMVHFLNPYRKNDCKQGRITNTEDFKYLARKLTHFVLAKELKHCKSVDELECNDNVKHKAKDFVRKYMNKFGTVYQRDKDED